MGGTADLRARRRAACVVGGGAARRAGHPDHDAGAGGGPGWCSPTSSARVGAVLVVLAAAARARCRCCSSGMSCSAAARAANLQARYTAVDLAEPARRGRQLSLVVWATTIGAVAGPNLAPLADAAVHGLRRCRATPARSCSARSRSCCARRCSCSLLLRPDPLLTAALAAVAAGPPRDAGREPRRAAGVRRGGAARGGRWRRPAARLGDRRGRRRPPGDGRR